MSKVSSTVIERRKVFTDIFTTGNLVSLADAPGYTMKYTVMVNDNLDESCFKGTVINVEKGDTFSLGELLTLQKSEFEQFSGRITLAV